MFAGHHKTDGSCKPLQVSEEKHSRDEESPPEPALTSSLTKRQTLSLKTNESDSNLPISDDSTGQAANGALSPSSQRKTVAINMSQNECFTHRLIPAVSPEFDIVMDQVCVCVCVDVCVCVLVCVMNDYCEGGYSNNINIPSSLPSVYVSLQWFF